MGELDNIKSFLFADEVKNTSANQNGEDSFYYFAVIVNKMDNSNVAKDYAELTKDLPKGFHAKDQYKAKGMDIKLLESLTNLLIKYKMPCICFRYEKKMLYEISKKHLANLDHTEISDRLNNWEFQAFFYFIQNLSLAFDKILNSIEFPIVAFFDKGIYGINEKIEAIDFDSERLKRAVFTSTNKIRLIGLADHLGFVFSKSRKSFKDQAPFDLTSLSQDIFGQQLLKIVENKLFIYLEGQDWLEHIQIKSITK